MSVHVFCPLFDWIVRGFGEGVVFAIESYEFFTYFGYRLVTCTIRDYFLPFGRSAFRLVDGLLCRAEAS